LNLQKTETMMKNTYEKPAMRVVIGDGAELLVVSGYGMSGGLVDHGEHVPGSRSIDFLDDEDEE
jgi:hypothetical protein